MKQFMDRDFPLSADASMDTKVCPTFRPDKILDIEKPTFADYIHELEDVAGFEFMCIMCVRKALVQRICYFFDNGCRTADHNLGYVPCVEASVEELSAIFRKGMAGEALTQHEIDAYKTDLLLTCAREYAKRGMVMQIHSSCPSSTSQRMFEKLECEGLLPKTIFCSLNPDDNTSRCFGV